MGSLPNHGAWSAQEIGWIYAASDIPETESYGRLEGGDGRPLLFEFAASAANVAGRHLRVERDGHVARRVTVTLAKIKKIIDRQFFAGVNHTFYHGTAYSPADADWPGWLFYASTQLDPQEPHLAAAICEELKDEGHACQINVGVPGARIRSAPCTVPDSAATGTARGFQRASQVHNAAEWFVGSAAFGMTARMVERQGLRVRTMYPERLLGDVASKMAALWLPVRVTRPSWSRMPGTCRRRRCRNCAPLPNREAR